MYYHGSGVDFDSYPNTVKFAAGEISQSFNISVTCDKIVEGRERFDILLKLVRNNPQVRAGRDRLRLIVIDSTGNDTMKQ